MMTAGPCGSHDISTSGALCLILIIKRSDMPTSGALCLPC